MLNASGASIAKTVHDFKLISELGFLRNINVPTLTSSIEQPTAKYPFEPLEFTYVFDEVRTSVHKRDVTATPVKVLVVVKSDIVPIELIQRSTLRLPQASNQRA